MISARPDAAQVVGECGVDELGGAGATHQGLAEVADVEQADGLAGGVVLGHGAGVRHRHQPAAEFGETRPEFAVTVFQRALQQFAHGQTA